MLLLFGFAVCVPAHMTWLAGIPGCWGGLVSALIIRNAPPPRMAILSTDI